MRPPHQHFLLLSASAHTLRHGNPWQTEPIILTQAMGSLMSGINSNHRICHDGDGFLCLFALIMGRSDSFAEPVFTVHQGFVVFPLIVIVCGGGVLFFVFIRFFFLFFFF